MSSKHDTNAGFFTRRQSPKKMPPQVARKVSTLKGATEYLTSKLRRVKGAEGKWFVHDPDACTYCHESYDTHPDADTVCKQLHIARRTLQQIVLSYSRDPFALQQLAEDFFAKYPVRKSERIKSKDVHGFKTPR